MKHLVMTGRRTALCARTIALFSAALITLQSTTGVCARPPKALPNVELAVLGSYASGSFNAGGAEIVAHDPTTQRLYVVNAQAASVDVLDISNPATPSKIGQINLLPFGGVANSVAA